MRGRSKRAGREFALVEVTVMCRNVGILFIALLISSVLSMDGPCLADVATDLREAATLADTCDYHAAGDVYTGIVSANPGTEEAFQAQRKLPQVRLLEGDPMQAQAELRRLLTDFSSHERLPHAVHEMVEKCHNSDKAEEVRQLCQTVADSDPCDPQTIWLRMGVAIANARLRDERAVQSAVDQIISEFSTDDRAAEALGQIAWSRKKLGEYHQARDYYRYVAKNWPQKSRAVFSQRGVAHCSMIVGEWEEAEQAVEDLLTNYSTDPHFVTAVSSIAEEYRNRAKYAESKRLHRLIVDEHSDDEQAIMSLRGIALCSIGLKDKAATDSAIEQLFAEFQSDDRIAKVSYQIARKLPDDPRAEALYRYIIQNKPQDRHASLARANMVNIKNDAGDATGAAEGLAGLMADHADDPMLPKAIAIVADGYYRRGLEARERGDDAKAAALYKMARQQWRKVLEDFPEIPYTTAEADYFTGVTYDFDGQHALATYHYLDVVYRWPDFVQAAQALFRVGRMYEDLVATEEVAASEADPVIEAAYSKLVRDYPESPGVKIANRWLSNHK